MPAGFARSMSLVLFAVSLASCGGGGGGARVASAMAVVPAPVVSATALSVSATATSSPHPAASATAAATATAAAIVSATASPNAVPTGNVTNLSSVTDFQRTAMALAASQRSDGAIPYTATNVNPYFATIAAIGAVRTGADAANVRNYMAWYVARTHDANPWGIAGAITDYTILGNGTLQSTNTADSIDSYAATFLTLASNAWQYGDAATRTYVQSIRSDVERIASAIDAVTDTDGFTWALPTYRFKYVMDQSEVYAGLNDLAVLRANAYGDVAGALLATQRASALRAGIIASYWNETRGLFAVATDTHGTQTLPDATAWADAMTQLAPILHGVIPPSSTQAQGIYARFNAAFPAWTSLSKPDQYPWTSVAYVALMMNDTARANAYRAAANAAFGTSFAYPWYCAESGWYLRVIDGLVVPQTIAAD